MGQLFSNTQTEPSNQNSQINDFDKIIEQVLSGLNIPQKEKRAPKPGKENLDRFIDRIKILKTSNTVNIGSNEKQESEEEIVNNGEPENQQKEKENKDDFENKMETALAKMMSVTAEKPKQGNTTHGMEEFGREMNHIWNNEKTEKLNPELQQLQDKIDKRSRESKKEMEEFRKSDEDFKNRMDEMRKGKMEDELAFKKLLEEQDNLYRAKMEKLREERDRLDLLKKMNEYSETLISCLILKRKWEEKEKEWADWLIFLRKSIIEAKNSLSKFESVLVEAYMEGFDDITTEYLQNQIEILRQSVLTSQHLLYDAFSIVDNLSEENPDRDFLVILKYKLSKTCNALLSVLLGIDKVKIDGNTSDVLRNLFDAINPDDIPMTYTLRKLEANGDIEQFRNVNNPMKYDPSTQTSTA